MHNVPTMHVQHNVPIQIKMRISFRRELTFWVLEWPHLRVGPISTTIWRSFRFETGPMIRKIPSTSRKNQCPTPTKEDVGLTESSDKIVAKRRGLDALQKAMKIETTSSLKDYKIPNEDGRIAGSLYKKKRKKSKLNVLMINFFVLHLRYIAYICLSFLPKLLCFGRKYKCLGFIWCRNNSPDCHTHGIRTRDAWSKMFFRWPSGNSCRTGSAITATWHG